MNHAEIARAMQQAIANSFDLRVDSIVLVKTTTIAKTSSGKIQRHVCQKQYLEKSLQVVGSWRAQWEEPTAVDSGPALLAGPSRLTRESLLSTARTERHQKLEMHLAASAARALRVRTSTLTVDQPLSNAGIDSVTVAELMSQIEDDFGVIIPLAEFFDGISISQLATKILDLMAPAVDAPLDGEGPGVDPAVSRRDQSAVDQDLLQNLDQLTADEINQLLTMLQTTSERRDD